MLLDRRRRRWSNNTFTAGGGGATIPTLNTTTELWCPDGGGNTSATYTGGTPLVIPSGLVKPCLALFLNSYKAATEVRLDNSTGPVLTLAGAGPGSADGNRSYLYVLPNPTTDGVTGHTIWVATAYRLGEAILAVYEHVDQVTPVGASQVVGPTGATNTPFSFPAVASVATDRVLVCLAALSLTSVATSDGTLVAIAGSPLVHTVAVAGYHKPGGNPSTAVGFSTDGAHNLTGVAVALKGA